MEHSLTDILKDEIKLKYQTVYKMSASSGIPYMTISSVLKRGVENSTVGTVAKICEALHTSIDQLIKQQKLMNIADRVNDMENPISDEELEDELIETGIIDTYALRGLSYEQIKNYVFNMRNFLSDNWLGKQDLKGSQKKE